MATPSSSSSSVPVDGAGSDEARLRARAAARKAKLAGRGGEERMARLGMGDPSVTRNNAEAENPDDTGNSSGAITTDKEEPMVTDTPISDDGHQRKQSGQQLRQRSTTSSSSRPPDAANQNDVSSSPKTASPSTRQPPQNDNPAANKNGVDNMGDTQSAADNKKEEEEAAYIATASAEVAAMSKDLAWFTRRVGLIRLFTCIFIAVIAAHKLLLFTVLDTAMRSTANGKPTLDNLRFWRVVRFGIGNCNLLLCLLVQCAFRSLTTMLNWYVDSQREKVSNYMCKNAGQDNDDKDCASGCGPTSSSSAVSDGSQTKDSDNVEQSNHQKLMWWGLTLMGHIPVAVEVFQEVAIAILVLALLTPTQQSGELRQPLLVDDKLADVTVS
eukprot:Selendium_serpulae@DN6081_c0_g1_i11.p3